MPEPDAVTIAVLQERQREIRHDLGELVRESQRTSKRLHDLEGVSGMLVEQEKLRREATALRDRRINLRLQALTVVVAAASIAEPFLYHLANGG